jgi:hypothetical protein
MEEKPQDNLQHEREMQTGKSNKNSIGVV